MLGRQSDAALLRFDRQPNPWVDPSEDAIASINYTSGTTARPKGVELTHRNLYLNALTFGWHAGVDDRDVYLWAVPMFHCNGWGLVYAITAMGGTHVMLRKVDGPEILRRIDREGVTFMGGAPAVVSTILTAAEAQPGPTPGRGRMRIVVGGAPPPTAVIERVETELGWEFMQIYGLTETSPLMTLNRRRAEWDDLTPAGRARQLGRAGPPAIGIKVRIDDDGEVLARGNAVFRGYWNQPAETAEVVRDGWFHTGDGGRVDDHGYLTISDRKKDVIITGGENVSSIEVEDTLVQHPAVAEAAVIGVPDTKWGETVKALVVLRPGAHATEQELLAHCRTHLAHYKCPTSIEFDSALARTATGKIQKFKLRAPYWSGRDRLVNCPEPAQTLRWPPAVTGMLVTRPDAAFVDDLLRRDRSEQWRAGSVSREVPAVEDAVAVVENRCSRTPSPARSVRRRRGRQSLSCGTAGSRSRTCCSAYPSFGARAA